MWQLNILFLSLSIFSQCLCGRIYFEKCNNRGFSCKNSTLVSGPQEITYQCNNVYGQDVIIYLWQFLKPSTKTTLIIKDCHTLRLYFGCTSDTKNDLIQLLHIQNVKNLRFIPAALSHNPPTIIFENITYIETIPRNTFSQIKNKSFKPGCFNPTSDFDALIFQNVKIGTIETEAFENLTNMKYFRWENVLVKKINAGGIKITGEKDSNMQILNSNVEILEPLALQVVGEKLIVLGSTIDEMLSSSLNGTLHVFEFSYNSVKNVQAGAFSISAQDVDIVGNHFEHLHSGALQKMMPGLHNHHSPKNSGKLKFAYNFRQNFIRHVDAGGLHPDILAYKKISTDVIFANNSLSCTCEGLAWLGAEILLGVGYSDLEDFHEMVLEKKNNNTCAFLSCDLPLEAIRKLILPNGKCQKSTWIKQKEICELYRKSEMKTKERLTANFTSSGRIVNVNIILLIISIFL